jgi:uncharacterized protein (TIGR02099 family)
VTPPSDRPPTLARELGARAQAIEHAVEHALTEQIEHSLHAAEASIARRFGTRAVGAFRLGLRAIGWLLVIAFFAVGLTMLAARYWLLPRADEWRPQIEGIASSALHAPVRIGRIEASWRGLNPVLALNEVEISGQTGTAVLSLPRIEGTLSWTSVAALEPRFSRLRIYAPELAITLLAAGRVSVAGFIFDPADTTGDGKALDWLLAQDGVVIRDARVNLRDERDATPRDIVFSNADMLLDSGLGTTRFALQLAPPPALAAAVDLRGEFSRPTFGRLSDFKRWRGDLFAQVDYVDLAQLNDWLHAPLAVRRAQGALRTWIRVDGTEVVGATADLALTNVDARLAPDLEPLQLRSFQGRVTQKRWGDDARGGQQYGLTGVTFVLASGVNFPPLDLAYRTTRSDAGERHVELEGARVDLTGVAAIATHLPIGRELRDAIARYAPTGRLAEFVLQWDGEEPRWATLAAKARFEDLSVAAQPARPGPPETASTPGFERLSGIVQIERGAGSLQLTSRDAALVFPGVFHEPRIPLNQLAADLRWKSGSAAELKIAQLVLSNADLELSASGTWRAPTPAEHGPGTVDLSARIARLDARHAHRYVPTAAGEGTLSWLQHALLEGQLTEGVVRLRGNLARFPFAAPAEGEFRATGRMRNVVLDVAPATGPNGERTPGKPWPLLRDIDGELLFERQGMTFRAQRGAIGGARIADATARIADLTHNAKLEVRGQVDGALTAILSYVNSSPVAGLIGDITRGAEVKGSGRVDLKLDVPLAGGGDLRVNGVLRLQNNDLTLTDVPPFTRVNGTLGFSERGVRFENLTAGFLGGQARLDASTRDDGAVVVTAVGTATPAGLRRALDVDMVQRILDRTQGSARYSATLTAQRGAMTLQADSDLIGLAIDGIAPLRKAAGESLPLRFEKSIRGPQDELRVTAGRLLGVHIERRQSGGTLQLARGVIALNEPANLPERGLLVLVALPRIDVEAWADWLGIGTEPAAPHAPGAPDGEVQIDHIALRTPELIVNNRSFRNVTLGATRTDTGGYDANVVSDGAAGYIGWRPGARGSTGGAGLGLVSARLSKLQISNNRKSDVVDVLRAPARRLPALEVEVENFELGDMKLGRLDLSAANVGTGNSAAWKVSRLDLVNPDMKLAAHGEWLPGATGALRTQVRFAFDVKDVGATLGRFGMRDAVARGRGKLEGNLEWVGSPIEINYPTMSGALSLRVEDGRFLKVDTRGAGRLLTLLSLQSLSQTLLADTRETFGEGFAFSSIRADATVARGVIATQDFRMAGTGAAALMSGTVNLNTETQQLHLVVLPDIDASTAALAVAVANPIVGLGALLANTVLRGTLSRAFALEYDISGPWSDPVVVRRGRITPSPTEQPR